jgi:DeoR family suf operon transcriptional repressor
MRDMHANQRKILDFLLEHKTGATLEELAHHLGITNTATKEHILKVEALGYLSYVDTKGAIGRPRRRYILSEEIHDAFPKQYSWLSTVLLELLAQNLGKDGVTHLMTELADKVAGSMARQFENASSSSDLLARMAGALNELGYRMSVKQSDLRKGAVLEATNCVYHNVAKQHPELCRFDIRFIENVSKMDVKLESCIARGGSVCRFCLKEKPLVQSLSPEIDANNFSSSIELSEPTAASQRPSSQSPLSPASS